MNLHGFLSGWIACCAAVLTLVSGCAGTSREASAQGSRHTHRFQLPPEKAARCFARNAEDHSSALMSEVNMQRDGNAEVIVRVKNGVTYATADIRRAGAASTGTIILMVRTSGRRGDLLDSLVAGC